MDKFEHKISFDKVKINKIDNLDMYYANVDSFLNKKDELVELIDTRSPHIIVLVETLPKKYRFQIEDIELKIDNYEMIKNYKSDNNNL